ncbi:MarR family transcriptional regulator [Gordonia sp. (in: high G+C Gram-positive bacteria)]|uniref:MarR family winged helix-turn-helix transcriptional regulator n=1 Tax=Gordonia sp. (in: high G+C Gram-positive bacteria) TaxID=84139 RepID=UPI00169F13FE|nr:MarR family transcriptional regulator [Gordonia sp. (in: high G+C Gram-positive bacteria)]NLG46765.1 MarR family transcriptional regulator [Gordonia sp. (in: high G+C Gram-positive bacteria)]
MAIKQSTADDDELGVGLLLFIHYRAMETQVFQALDEAGFTDITPAQARLLQRIGRDGTRVTELAEAAQVTKQTASFLVDQLERAGYVRRTPDPADARARLVHIADRAETVRPVADAAVAEVEAEWRAHLGARRWDQLRAALTDLRALTDPYM